MGRPSSTIMVDLLTTPNALSAGHARMPTLIAGRFGNGYNQNEDSSSNDERLNRIEI